MSKTEPTQFERLAAPFDWDEVEVKVGSLSKQKDEASAIVYFDARAVRDRLNRVLGRTGWQIVSQTFFPVGQKSGCQIQLQVTMDGETVTAWGEDDLSDIEPIKGGKSGAFKRAFSELANDTLYTLDMGWWPCVVQGEGAQRKFKKFTDASLKGMKARYEAHFKGQMLAPAPEESDDNQAGAEFVAPLTDQEIKDYIKPMEFVVDEYKALQKRLMEVKFPVAMFLAECRRDRLTTSAQILARLAEDFPLSPSEASVEAQRPLAGAAK